jgi:glutaredoxin
MTSAFTDPNQTVVYGRDTCEDTTRARAFFDTAGHPYRYVDLDHEPTVAMLLQAAGLTATPVVVDPSGRIEVEPADDVLGSMVGSSV